MLGRAAPLRLYPSLNPRDPAVQRVSVYERFTRDRLFLLVHIRTSSCSGVRAIFVSNLECSSVPLIT